MNRVKYKFSHKAGGRYYWYAVLPLRGSFLREEISCDVDWFWSK